MHPFRLLKPPAASPPDGSADQAAQPEQLLRPQAFSKVPLPGRDPLLLEGLRQLEYRGYDSASSPAAVAP
jgi:hypothetical protein